MASRRTAGKATMKAPLPWYGGKQQIAQQLAALLPPHQVYVEVFGGAASLLFTKSRSAVEVYNDLDSGLVNFFRVLRDETRCRELVRLLDLTPYAREEWNECRLTWQMASTDVEMARRWYMALSGSFGKHLGSGSGWSFTKDPSHVKTRTFRSATEQLSRFTERLRYVQVEQGDFARMIALYDEPRTLFYCDPPYVPETRQRADRYRHEMTVEDHERLLSMLAEVRGMVVLSGYDSLLYRRALKGWRRVDFDTVTCASHTTRAARKECIWLSPNATAHQPTLPFEQAEEVNHASA